MQRERWAVSALFLTNGALFASVLPRLPEIKDRLDLSDGQLGLALLGVGLGGLAASAGSRWVLPRLGSRWLAVGGTLVLAALVRWWVWRRPARCCSPSCSASAWRTR